MQTLFILYVLYAIVTLIWTSARRSRAELRHVVISHDWLNERAALKTNSIVIELHSEERSSAAAATIPGSLLVSRAELVRLVSWTPPGSILVFKEQGEGRRLDSNVERTLLDLGIGAVYWLNKSRDEVPRRQS